MKRRKRKSCSATITFKWEPGKGAQPQTRTRRCRNKGIKKVQTGMKGDIPIRTRYCPGCAKSLA